MEKDGHSDDKETQLMHVAVGAVRAFLHNLNSGN